MQNKLKTFSMRISVEQYSALEKIAESEQVSISQCIRRAIREFLASQSFTFTGEGKEIETKDVRGKGQYPKLKFNNE